MERLKQMAEAMPAQPITHCFYSCGHKTVDRNTTGSSDAMERHYWDEHYDQATRDELRAKGHPAERMGETP